MSGSLGPALPRRGNRRRTAIRVGTNGRLGSVSEIGEFETPTAIDWIARASRKDTQCRRHDLGGDGRLALDLSIQIQ